MKLNDDAELSGEQLKILHAALLAARAEVLGHPLPTRPADREAPDTGDEMDAADHVSEVEAAGARTQRDRSRLLEIERALGKMERGEYGVSEGSGEPIGFGRLRILPWAKLTVEEEEALERRR